MENNSYASFIESLMYAQEAEDLIWFCYKCSTLIGAEEVFSYLKRTKNFTFIYFRSNFRYVERTKNFTFMYSRCNALEVVGYTNMESGGSKDDMNPSGYTFLLGGGTISCKSI